jgi:hypothetical protein
MHHKNVLAKLFLKQKNSTILDIWHSLRLQFWPGWKILHFVMSSILTSVTLFVDLLVIELHWVLGHGLNLLWYMCLCELVVVYSSTQKWKICFLG